MKMKGIFLTVAQMALVGVLVVTFTAIPFKTPAQTDLACRNNIGGVYAYGHVSKNTSGRFQSSILLIHFHPGSPSSGGTFDIGGSVNEEGIGVYPVSAFGRPYSWIGGCMLQMDRPGWIGRVSDDGRFISFGTFDTDISGGTAVRTQ